MCLSAILFTLHEKLLSIRVKYGTHGFGTQILKIVKNYSNIKLPTLYCVHFILFKITIYLHLLYLFTKYRYVLFRCASEFHIICVVIDNEITK